jgi:hypothetical protein
MRLAAHAEEIIFPRAPRQPAVVAFDRHRGRLHMRGRDCENRSRPHLGCAGVSFEISKRAHPGQMFPAMARAREVVGKPAVGLAAENRFAKPALLCGFELWHEPRRLNSRFPVNLLNSHAFLLLYFTVLMPIGLLLALRRHRLRGPLSPMQFPGVHSCSPAFRSGRLPR